jgi:hypothetical protein
LLPPDHACPAPCTIHFFVGRIDAVQGTLDRRGRGHRTFAFQDLGGFAHLREKAFIDFHEIPS